MKIQFQAGWGYYHSSNALQYSNTAQERVSPVMYDSNTFLYGVRLLVLALRTS